MLHATRTTDDDGGALGGDGGASAGADDAPQVGTADGGTQAGLAEEPPVWSPPSWEQIVVEHSPRVYRLAYRLTGNKADAEDLTQETFVRVFRSLHKYEPGNFEGWLHRITTNLFLDQARRRTRVRMDPIGEATERLPAAHDSGEPERGFEHAHLDLDVQAALDALPPKYRAAVVLCDIEGLSYEEIAATLGIKMGTVRSRIHRARAMLRDQLAHRRPASVVNPAHAAQAVG
ncbi:RNA polymerase sigma factor SigE [Georgenia daeguensis]|uniref:RNA polymerase sigma factor SigE n=1 Tax=Georgenia daeguensis TaxID=908355 RepID=A0ABP8EUY2_9MICO